MSLVIAASLLLSACVHEVTQRDIETADYGTFPANYKEAIEGFMQGTLFDPYSAMYRYLGEPMRAYAHVYGGINPPEFGHLVEVGINAKNQLGAYTGEKLYVFLFKNDRMWRINNPTHPFVVIVGPANKQDQAKQQAVAPTAPSAAAQLESMVKALEQTSATKDTSGLKFGIVPGEVTPVIANLLQMPEVGGVFVTAVYAGSVASRAGVKKGDVILKYGDKALSTNPDQLKAAVTATPPGTTVPITVWRIGQEIALSAQF